VLIANDSSSRGAILPDLIFHLGLTKTASTFLQKKVFLGKMYTLARARDREYDTHKSREFQKVMHENPPAFWQSPEGKHFFDHDPKLSQNVLISHESIYDHVPFPQKNEPTISGEPLLFASKLKEISEHCWPHGQTKAFFFFRRQADWLASIYAHTCWQLPEPSQKDFDARVEALLDGSTPGLNAVNYSLLLESLENSLGAGNVLALPHEDFQKDATWEKLRNFTGIPDLGVGTCFQKRSVNVKRLPGEEDWQISAKASRKKWASCLGPILRRLTTPGQRESLRRWLGSTIQEERRIGISDELSERVMARFQESNRKLAAQTETDLVSHRYF
jgi:hypothetical protein